MSLTISTTCTRTEERSSVLDGSTGRVLHEGPDALEWALRTYGPGATYRFQTIAL